MAQQAQGTISAGFGTVRLIRDATLGTGAYGQVCKATLDGKPCAAKLLHPILVDPNNPRNLIKFEQECRLLSEIRHPNIVQCLGVAQDGETGLPVLLMELMDYSLTHFLEQSEEPLAYHVQVNISHDIALAVAFLHSKHIIHRDLSSNNVLLSGDGKRAKVTDFGMSKLDSHMTGLTKCPGTAAYMSPEALLDPPVYTEKLDCFQIGVLMIQIITCKFPDPGPESNRMRDARYPTGWIKAPVPEMERRQNHLSLIPQTHPMLCVAVDCLKDMDNERPSAQQICEALLALKAVSQYGQSLLKEGEQLVRQLRQENQVKEMEIREKETEIRKKERNTREKEREVREKDGEIESLQSRLKQKESEVREKEMKIGEKERNIREKEREVREKNGEIESLQSQLQQKERRIREMERDKRMKMGRRLREHYDILLLGRVGMGKSTTARKLVGIEEHQESRGSWFNELWVLEDGAVNKTRRLISHQGTNIRVLDTWGFADWEMAMKHGVKGGNQLIFQEILKEQRKHDLTFRRVLYFLPYRTPPDYADGALQEEIKVIYELLGQDTFNIMVIIATCRKERKHQVGYDEDDIDQTKRVFTTAFERATWQRLPKCPPVIYLPFDETDVLSKIVAAEVISDLPQLKA